MCNKSETPTHNFLGVCFLRINLRPTHKPRPTRRSHIQVWKKQHPLLLLLSFALSATQWRWLGQSSSFSSLFSSASYTSSLLVKVGFSDIFHYNVATTTNPCFNSFLIKVRLKNLQNRATPIVVWVHISRIREKESLAFLIYFALKYPYTKQKQSFELLS